jgi:hypothetical protein
MKKNIFKKIITLTYLIIFLFSLFAPLNQIFADSPFRILIPKVAIKTDEYTTITAQMSLSTLEGRPVKFISSPAVEGFNGQTCTLNKDSSGIWSCIVNFKSSAKGIYAIQASVSSIQTGQTYLSENISVGVTGTDNPPPPPPTDPQGTCTIKKISNSVNFSIFKLPTQMTKIDCYKEENPKCTSSDPTLATNTPCTIVLSWDIPSSTGPLGDCVPADGVGPPNQTTQVNCQPPNVWSAAGSTSDSLYHFLAPLPCTGTPESGCVDGKLVTFDPTQENNLGTYLNLIIKIFIGISAVLAVIMIVMGGIEYMTSELISNKEHGKEKITHAILGLLLALGAYTLLYTINPDILRTDLTSLEKVTVEVILGSNSIYIKPAADSARCVPVTSGPCTTTNLSSIFGSKAEAMSKICNIESGGNAASVSKTDKGSDNTPFSFGLFQINLLANGSIIKGANGESCSNLFVRNDGSPISGGNYIKKDSSGKFYYDARLAPNKQNTYNNCKATLLDPVKNIQIAKQLPLTAWKYSDYGVCPSAFN